MQALKLITSKALNNLHVTVPVGVFLGVILVAVCATSYANKYENRLKTVEDWRPQIEKIEIIQQNVLAINNLNEAVREIDQKFEQRFEGFQSDFKELVVELWKQK